MKRYIQASQRSNDALYDLAEQMEKVFEDNHLWTELYDVKYYESLPVAQISFLIRGDWKHDHLFANELVKENFDSMPRMDEVVTEDTGSDYYPAIHTYYILMR